MKINNISKIGIVLAVLILLSVNVLAFGVGSKYWQENPLIISPGETKDIFVTLQNMAGETDLLATGKITTGSEIAWITDADKTYLVPTGGEIIQVNIRVSVPIDAQLGDLKELIISFTTQGTGDGPLSIGSAVEREIPISIQEKPKEVIVEEAGMPAWVIYLILVIIALIIIIVIIVKNKKK